MYIEHIALWTNDLERLKTFYEQFFGARVNGKYVNATKNFESFFLSFESGARLEIMCRPNLTQGETVERVGLAHFALALGSCEAVDALTKKLRDAGVKVVSEPRRTGDGYYESVILDPDGNQIELTC